MLIIPAIDLKDGSVVRLYKGRLKEKKIYSDDPARIARLWKRQGAKLIHVVDLDGAFYGYPKNIPALKKILKVAGIKVQFGGGARSEQTIKKLFAAGASRVILGTAAFTDRKFLSTMLKKYKEKIIVSVDLKSKGVIALKGWVEAKGRQVALEDYAARLSGLGVKRIIYTDIERDGTLSGPRVSLLEKYLYILGKYGIRVIMAGGISSLDDIKALKRLEKMGLEGIIVGKALYEGRLDLAQAIKTGGKNEE